MPIENIDTQQKEPLREPCEVEKGGELCGNPNQVGWMFTFPGVPIPICKGCWEFYAEAFPETVSYTSLGQLLYG